MSVATRTVRPYANAGADRVCRHLGTTRGPFHGAHLLLLALAVTGPLEAGGVPSLVGNGHFVTDLRDWARVGPVQFSYWSDLDVDGSTGSGSVQMQTSVEGRHVLRRQCLRIIDRSARYRYEFASYLEPFSAAGYPSLQFKFHESQDCSSVPTLYGIVPFGGAPGTWQRHIGVLEIPPGAPVGYSIEIELAMTREQQDGFGEAIGNIDAIELFDDDRLFEDGFDRVEME